MSYYVWGSHLSYQDYLQGKSFVSDVTSATRSAGRAVSMEISRQTRAVIASNEAMARDNIRAIEANADAMNAGFDRLSYGLSEISAGISELNATFHWGFGEVIASLGHMNDTLSELVKIAKTPVQTVAFNHFEIARDAFRQGLYQESLDELEKAIAGDHTSAGYKLEWRFHQMKGTLQLGFVGADMSLVDLAKAEASFVLAARYGKTDYAEDAGRAFLSAGWAAYCQGKMKEALAHTEQAMELHPRMGEGFFQAAKIQMALGQVDTALPMLGNAIERNSFFALKAASDGDFQKHDNRLRVFLEAMRREKCRQSMPRVQAAMKEFQFLVDHEPNHDLLRPFVDFLAKGESLPLVDVQDFARTLDEKIVAAKNDAMSAHIVLRTKMPVTFQHEVVIKPKSLFHKAVTEIQTKTLTVEAAIHYDGLGNKIFSAGSAVYYDELGNKIFPRFDGIYYSSERGFGEYLRFYEDGTVLTASTTGSRPEEGVVRWFRRESTNDLSHGHYVVTENSVSFSSTSKEGTVEYEGNADDALLYLNSYSHINGHRGSKTYNFIQLDET